MLCFEVFRNGERLCRAGIQEAQVLSAMLTWVGGAPRAKSPKARTKAGDLTLHVGALYNPKPGVNAHPAWLDQALNRGDEIMIRIVDASKADEPYRVSMSSPEEIEKQQRAYYEEMKKRYEGKTAKTSARVAPLSTAKSGPSRARRRSAK